MKVKDYVKKESRGNNVNFSRSEEMFANTARGIRPEDLNSDFKKWITTITDKWHLREATVKESFKDFLDFFDALSSLYPKGTIEWFHDYFSGEIQNYKIYKRDNKGKDILLAEFQSLVKTAWVSNQYGDHDPYPEIEIIARPFDDVDIYSIAKEYFPTSMKSGVSVIYEELEERYAFEKDATQYTFIAQ